MRREDSRFTITCCSIALAGVVFAVDANAACARETLTKLADTYVKAQTDGKSSMVPLVKGAYYGENDVAMDISKGVLAGPLKIDFTRSFYDTTQCAAFTEVVAATDPHPYVIHTRMEATEKGDVTRMESVVADQGDWAFGATEYLNFTKAENWGEIPANQRGTREVIKAAAEAYINNWGDPALPVPHGTPCARLEGRMYTGTRDPNAQACTMGAFPRPLVTGHRRFVIDETMGAVSIFHDFPFIDGGLPADHPGTPASQMFRVEGGKNRYIHESTVCTTPNCGRAAGGGGKGKGGPGGGKGKGGPGAPAAAPAQQ
jgi:hypothetical protein